MKRFERDEFLANADELERLLGDVANGQSRAAARISIHLGEDDAGDAEPFMEFVGRLYCVLAGHGVCDEQDLGRVEERLQLLQLGHELLVNVKPSSGIDQEDVATCLHGLAPGATGQFNRRLLLWRSFVYRNLDVAGNDRQLLARGGTIHVNGHQQGPVVLLGGEIFREFPGGRGFAGALKADDHHDSRRFIGETEPRGMRSEDFDQLVADDLDNLLRRGKRGEHFLPHRLFLNALDELLNDAEMHVGFQQRDAYLAERGFHVLRREFALSAEIFENALKLIAEILEHSTERPDRSNGCSRGRLLKTGHLLHYSRCAGLKSGCSHPRSEMPASDARPERAASVASRPPHSELIPAPAAQPSYEVVTRQGRRVAAGDGPPQFTIHLTDGQTVEWVVNSDAYQMAVAFVRGEFDVSGDLLAAIRWKMGAPGRGFAGWVRRVTARLASLGAQRWFQTRRQAARNIQYHYDASNEFYELFLDSRLVYSCAYFKDPGWSIDQAQAAKLEYICRKLGVQPGERFLDIGCGWGALILHAAGEHGAIATGCTLSRNQDR